MREESAREAATPPRPAPPVWTPDRRPDPAGGDRPDAAPGRTIQDDDRAVRERLTARDAAAAELAAEGRLRRRGRRGGLLALVLVVVAVAVAAGAAYAVLSSLAFDRVPRNTVVAGVDIGGTRYPEARGRVRRAVAASASRPVAVTGSGITASVVPARAGLVVDVAASVDAAGPVTSRDPVRLVRGLLATPRRLDPVVRVDRVRLDAAVAGIARGYDVGVRESSIRLVGSVPEVVQPLAGRRLDRPRTSAALVAAVTRGEAAATAVTATVAPRTSPAAVRATLRSTIPRMLSGPVRLSADGRSANLTASQLADHTTFVPRGTGLALSVDGAGLRAERPDPLAALEKPARNAQFTVTRSGVVLQPEVTGAALTDADLSAAVTRAAAATGGGRAVAVETRTTRARVTTRALASLGVRSVVGQFTGRYRYEPGLPANLTRAGGRLQGRVVPAGALLSLNGVLGQRTGAAGYVDGPVLVGGRYTTAVGGGVGQMATVLYDAAYAAGWGIVAHTPASIWTGIGPPGRDATISWPGIDLAVRNGTPAAAYVQVLHTPATPVADGTLTVRLLSRSWWSVRARTTAPSSVVRPPTVRDGGPTCVARPGSAGFRVTDRRTRTHPGAAPESYVFITRYRSSPVVVCG